MNDEKTTGRAAPPSAGPAQAFIRRPPRHGAVIRVLQLTINPEHWAGAARYSLFANIVVVFFAIFVAALVIASYRTNTIFKQAHAFAATYDTRHAPLILSRDATLAYAPGTPDNVQPLKFRYQDIQSKDTTLVIDPRNTTDLAVIATPRAVIITSNEILTRDGDTIARQPLQKLQPTITPLMGDAQTVQIDSRNIQQYLIDHAVALRLLSFFCFASLSFLSHSLWVLAMVLLFFPLVRLAALRLHMPRLIAVRIALVVNVPLIMLGAGLTLAGYSVTDTIGLDNAIVFWAIATAALCFWAGLLANRMYAPAPTNDPRRGM